MYGRCAMPNDRELLAIKDQIKEIGMWQCHVAVTEAIAQEEIILTDLFIKNIAGVKIDRAKKLLPYAQKILFRTIEILQKSGANLPEIYQESIQNLVKMYQESSENLVDFTPSNPHGSIKEERKIERKKERTPLTPQGGMVPFDIFWEAYPKKVSKSSAFGIWTRKKLNQHIDAIMVGLNAYKASEQWRKDGGAFIPMPSTFLNQERWTDEIYSPPPVGSGGMAEWH